MAYVVDSHDDEVAARGYNDHFWSPWTLLITPHVRNRKSSRGKSKISSWVRNETSEESNETSEESNDMSEEFSFSPVENRKFVPKKTEESYQRLVLDRLVSLVSLALLVALVEKVLTSNF